MLVFTVFPLGYSLFISFHKVDRKMRGDRHARPCRCVDAAGNPVLKSDGKPRTQTGSTAS